MRSRLREIQVDRDFKELARVIMEAGKSKICRVGQEAGDQGRAETDIQVRTPSAEFPLF